MIKIELFQGEPIICKGISSDPMNAYMILCQLTKYQIKPIFWKNIKHISAVL